MSATIDGRLRMFRITPSRSWAALISLVILGAFAAFGAANKDGIRIEVDSTRVRSQSELTVWTAYLLERTAFRSQHKVPVPSSGECPANQPGAVNREDHSD